MVTRKNVTAHLLCLGEANKPGILDFIVNHFSKQAANVANESYKAIYIMLIVDHSLQHFFVQKGPKGPKRRP